MTEDQRIGQLFELGLGNDRLGPTEINLIQNDHIGSVWFIATSSAGVAGIRAVSDAVQAQVSSASTANVRFFVAANQEGGVIQAMQGPGFSQIPAAVVQGTWAFAVLQSRATGWAQELRAAGINLNFAPVMDVVPPGTDAQNQPIGALQREYGHDPATVASHGGFFLLGMRQAGVAVTAKHFPGLGRVTGNTDFTTATDTVTTSSDPYLATFRTAIADNTDFVMVALARYTQIDPNHLAAFSPIVINQLLRGTLGYQGVIISDDLGATVAVASIPPATRAIDFLSAGGDMIISKTPAPADAMVQAIRGRVASDPSFRQRVDDAALRILRAKQAWTLLPC
ncbi:MAG TPA: glycoside hydrolase family 3 N-terminal domain-containing protein [Candidatus Dormibacteraeota bacterium]|nr:glycoside hydrolase family 3 N-terminal domain-containing protein [Candidatus Dormibacteraeota bacterium]